MRSQTQRLSKKTHLFLSGRNGQPPRQGDAGSFGSKVLRLWKLGRDSPFQSLGLGTGLPRPRQ